MTEPAKAPRHNSALLIGAAETGKSTFLETLTEIGSPQLLDAVSFNKQPFKRRFHHHRLCLDDQNWHFVEAWGTSYLNPTLKQIMMVMDHICLFCSIHPKSLDWLEPFLIFCRKHHKTPIVFINKIDLIRSNVPEKLSQFIEQLYKITDGAYQIHLPNLLSISHALDETCFYQQELTDDLDSFKDLLPKTKQSSSQAKAPLHLFPISAKYELGCYVALDYFRSVGTTSTVAQTTPLVQIYHMRHHNTLGKILRARLLHGKLSPYGCLDNTPFDRLYQEDDGKLYAVQQIQAGDLFCFTSKAALKMGEMITPTANLGKPTNWPYPTAGMILASLKTNQQHIIEKSYAALRKLSEEDAGIILDFTGPMLPPQFWCQNAEHARFILTQLKNRFGLRLTLATPAVDFEEALPYPVRTSFNDHNVISIDLEIQPLKPFQYLQIQAAPSLQNTLLFQIFEEECHLLSHKGILGFGLPHLYLYLHSVTPQTSLDSTSIRKALKDALQYALDGIEPILLEPTHILDIQLPVRYFRNFLKLIPTYRAHLLQKCQSNLVPNWYNISLSLPKTELENFNTALREATNDIAYYQVGPNITRTVTGLPKQWQRLPKPNRISLK